MKKFKTIEELKGHYSKQGGNGNLYEVLAKAILQANTTKNCHKYNGLTPMGKADKYSKALSHTFEFKTGCGWLSAESYTKEQAEQIKAEYLDGSRIYGSDLVCYNPKYMIGDTDFDILENSYIFTAEEFTEMLRTYKLFRIKKSRSGGYGVAIQTWQTTPTWGTAKNRMIEDELWGIFWSRETFGEFIGVQ